MDAKPILKFKVVKDDDSVEIVDMDLKSYEWPGNGIGICPKCGADMVGKRNEWVCDKCGLKLEGPIM